VEQEDLSLSSTPDRSYLAPGESPGLAAYTLGANRLGGLFMLLPPYLR